MVDEESTLGVHADGIWAVAYAVSENLVTEGSVGSFKIGQLPLLVLWAPAAIAFIYHSITALLASSAVTSSVKKVLYAKLFPDATQEQIEAINFSEGTLELEGMIAVRNVPASGCLWLSSGFVLVAILFSPWVLFAHTFYLALLTPFHLWSKSLVLGIACSAMIRAAFVQRLAWVIPPRRSNSTLQPTPTRLA